MKMTRDQKRTKYRNQSIRTYIPIPPGITYWKPVEVAGAKVLQPETRPLAVCDWSDLSDDDLRYLITKATQVAGARCINDMTVPDPDRWAWDRAELAHASLAANNI